MFKKSTTNQQLGLFTTASSLMCKRESKQYEDEKEWHMQFYRNVTCNIEADVFRLKCYFFVAELNHDNEKVYYRITVFGGNIPCMRPKPYKDDSYNRHWRF